MCLVRVRVRVTVRARVRVRLGLGFGLRLGLRLALAYAPQAPLLASASCDRTVLLWDLRTLQPCGSSGAAGDTHAHRDSVYCLATNPNASLLASGSVDSDVRLWDPREAEGHFTLRGHTDAVR